jgi:ppGpp synthetase/RelA/SpoT-type nucleotidyltranferase
MGDTILLVFEGEKTEPSIFDNIQEVFFNKSPGRRIYACFGTNIYKLWQELKDDTDFDTIIKLQELARNKDELKNLDRNNVSEIHLFFDFEGQILKDNQADMYCKIINEMLDIFNDENEHGKLWISYPMVEALKHSCKDLEKCFSKCIMKIKSDIHYKDHVGIMHDYQDVRKYTYLDWQKLIFTNIEKAHCLISLKYQLPEYRVIDELISQIKIFESQKERFILPASSVAVLSSFPFFLLYYFGRNLYQDIIHKNLIKPCKFKCLC